MRRGEHARWVDLTGLSALSGVRVAALGARPGIGKARRTHDAFQKRGKDLCFRAKTSYYCAFCRFGTLLALGSVAVAAAHGRRWELDGAPHRRCKTSSSMHRGRCQQGICQINVRSMVINPAIDRLPARCK
jgi:hypothetical protein